MRHVSKRSAKLLWWLSFVDGDRPSGKRFVGVCIVPGEAVIEAVIEAFRRGCNPGGEVHVDRILLRDDVHLGWIGRLIEVKDAFGLTLETIKTGPPSTAARKGGV